MVANAWKNISAPVLFLKLIIQVRGTKLCPTRTRWPWHAPYHGSWKYINESFQAYHGWFHSSWFKWLLRWRCQIERKFATCVCVSHLQNNNTAWADLPWQETAQCRINLICDLGPAPQPQISQVKYSSSSWRRSKMKGTYENSVMVNNHNIHWTRNTEQTRQADEPPSSFQVSFLSQPCEIYLSPTEAFLRFLPPHPFTFRILSENYLTFFKVQFRVG